MDTKQLVARMTLEEKASLCSGADAWQTKAVPRLGIPALRVSDGPHGLRKQEQGADNLGRETSALAVCFPAGCALASSFDRDLMARVGAALGRECQAEGVGVLLGPAVNIKRTPLCGRNFEYYSEDPLVASRMAAGYIEGLQSQGVGACLKHFYANNQETRRFSASSDLDERTAREIYLAAFEGAVRQAHPWTVMCAYNRINGVYAAENRQALTDILRGEWGFDGFVVSDWGATNDRVADLEAGMELEMPPLGDGSDDKIVRAVREGRLEEAVLDRAVERLLGVILRARDARQPDTVFPYEADHALARQAAAESMVLLQNDGMLPLDPGEKILVVGGFAEEPRYQGGGSSHINPYAVESAWDCLRREPDLQVRYLRGFSARGGQADPVDWVLEQARRADKVLVFAGLPESSESEGYDRQHMKLPPEQDRLIGALVENHPRVAVILHNGAPVEMPWADRAAAILETYLGGEAVGAAVVDVLYGRAEPGGRLAETFPLRLEDSPAYLTGFGQGDSVPYTEGVFVGYRYYNSRKAPVRFPFGHGLSYTTFRYEDLRLDRETCSEEETLTVTVRVTNTGARPGSDVVQLYLCPPQNGRMIRPAQELKDFAKVFLQPGQSREVRFRLGRRAFACYRSEIHDWFVESGRYTVQIAHSSRDVALTAPVTVQGRRTWLQKVTADTPLGDILAVPGAVQVLLDSGVPLDKQECAVDNENEEQILQAHYQFMPLRSRMLQMDARQKEEVLKKLRALLV